MNTEHPILEQILALRHEGVIPVAAAHRVDLVGEASLRTPPQLLLLGNHSSGKSSLINHLLTRKIQRTGVAPVDDGFTVLMHGEREHTLDGAALTTNPQLPFSGLARFGPGLVSHLQARVIQADLLKHIWLIDSPGMIDSGGRDATRPYDFAEVVRHFAERADLVLLFFDPEKPGTTGETLDVLTRSLTGIDHKLRIVMNKMDLFDGIRDFARTYGALCWNLSRCLTTKDMPHIYTTVIPELVRERCPMALDHFAAALLELEAAIAELPERRLDTTITRAIEEARRLHVRAVVTEALRSQVRRRFCLVTTLLALVIGLSGGVAASLFHHVGWGAGILACLLPLGTLALLRALPGWAARRVEEHGMLALDHLFQETFHEDLTLRGRADDLLADWQAVRGELARVLHQLGLHRLGRVSPQQLRRLSTIARIELPELRRV